MEINFFVIWFFISPFIILHLYLKNKDYKEKANVVIDKINDTWDKEYKEIIINYGSVSNFMDCHKKDFELMRQNIITFYRQVSCANREFIVQTDRLLDLIESDAVNKDFIYRSIKDIKKSSCNMCSDILSNVSKFAADEEEAHECSHTCKDALNEIDKEYKN